jgi:cell division protein ZipA
MEGFDDDPLMEGFDDGAESENIDDLDNLDLVADDVKENLMTSQSEQKYDALNQSASGSGRLKNKKTRKPIANVDDPNAVLIVTVVAKDQYLNGAALKRVVLACGMEFGDMQVFHRFEDGLDTGAVQFSMANAINPGTFDFDTMDHAATPGVSFFMSMDEPLDPKNALECMMATAETVATHLNGDLLDDDRSVIRPQTKEHYRERVRIHEMNKLTRRAL